MEKLVDQGLVRSVGLSNFNQEQIERLLSTPGLKYKPVAMQVGIRIELNLCFKSVHLLLAAGLCFVS